MAEVPAMYQALRELTETLIATLADEGLAAEHRLVREATMEAFVLHESGNWAVGEIPVPNISVRHDSLRHMHLLREAHQLADILLHEGFVEEPTFSDSAGKPVKLPSRENVVWAVCLSSGVWNLVAEFLRRLPTLAFDGELFDVCYQDFEAYNLCESVPHTTTAPIANFTADDDLVELTDGTSVVRLPDAEVARLGTYITQSHGIAPSSVGLDRIPGLLGCGFAIRTRFSVPKKTPIIEGEVQGRVRGALTALRLVKDGEPRCYIAVTEPEGFIPFQGRGLSHLAPYPGEHRKPVPLHLEAGDTEPLAHLWGDLLRLADNRRQGGLQVALRKFNELYGRSNVEDKAIDMCILLESTLLGDVKDELRYRLALRGAQLLKPEREPLGTHAVLKMLYDERSRIVHGGERLSDPVRLCGRELRGPAFVHEVQQLCREILRRLITRIAGGESLAAVLAGLDQSALLG